MFANLIIPPVRRVRVGLNQTAVFRVWGCVPCVLHGSESRAESIRPEAESSLCTTGENIREKRTEKQPEEKTTWRLFIDVKLLNFVCGYWGAVLGEPGRSWEITLTCNRPEGLFLTSRNTQLLDDPSNTGMSPNPFGFLAFIYFLTATVERNRESGGGGGGIQTCAALGKKNGNNTNLQQGRAVALVLNHLLQQS